MSYNKKMYGHGSRRSIIREIFEYSKLRGAEIGKENVYDFSLGNPSVPAPAEVNEAIRALLDERDSVSLHGYTSAQGDASVRMAIAKNIKSRFGIDISENLIYMTCGAAASLSLCLTDEHGHHLLLPLDWNLYHQPFPGSSLQAISFHSCMSCMS